MKAYLVYCIEQEWDNMLGFTGQKYVLKFISTDREKANDFVKTVLIPQQPFPDKYEYWDHNAFHKFEYYFVRDAKGENFDIREAEMDEEITLRFSYQAHSI